MPANTFDPELTIILKQLLQKVRDDEPISKLMKAFDELGKQAAKAALSLRNVGPGIAGLAAKLADKELQPLKNDAAASAIGQGSDVMGVTLEHYPETGEENQITLIRYTVSPPPMIDASTFDMSLPRMIPVGPARRTVDLEITNTTPEFVFGLFTDFANAVEVVLPIPSGSADLVVILTDLKPVRLPGGSDQLRVSGHVVAVNASA